MLVYIIYIKGDKPLTKKELLEKYCKEKESKIKRIEETFECYKED